MSIMFFVQLYKFLQAGSGGAISSLVELMGACATATRVTSHARIIGKGQVAQFLFIS